MTDIEVSNETLAHRIAARGRDALVERLRSAYSDAAAAHADIVSLDDERLEALVQRAADSADGLQWRRALAEVGAGELGVSVAEALSHPAVTRAQALVGAPSYEQSLAELIARPVPPPAPAPPLTGNGAVSAGLDGNEQLTDTAVEQEQHPAPPLEAVAVAEPEPEPEPIAEEPEPIAEGPEPIAEGPEPIAEELETVEADDVVFELLPEPDPVELETELYEAVPVYTEEEPPPTLEPEPFAADAVGAEPFAAEAITAEPFATDPAEAELAPEEDLQVPAVHLGGVANLPTKREGLSLRLSEDGLDILGEEEIIGRLVWDEIDALEVPHLRSRRRRQQLRARLVVRTPHGDASFEVPEISGDELRDRIEPLIAQYGHH
jgi:hypothetical protein